LALSRTHRGLGDKNCPRCGLENVVKVFRETYGRDPTSEEIRTFQEYIYLIKQGRRKMNLECEANEIKIEDRVTEECLAAS